MCAKCGKLVDSFSVHRRHVDERVAVRAVCHGEVDERLTDRYFLEEALTGAHLEGVAFDSEPHLLQKGA